MPLHILITHASEQHVFKAGRLALSATDRNPAQLVVVKSANALFDLLKVSKLKPFQPGELNTVSPDLVKFVRARTSGLAIANTG
jgi:hypothetical protein